MKIPEVINVRRLKDGRTLIEVDGEEFPFPTSGVVWTQSDRTGPPSITVRLVAKHVEVTDGGDWTVIREA